MAIRNDPVRGPQSSPSPTAAPSSSSTLLDPKLLPKTADGLNALAVGSRFEVFNGGSKLELQKLDANRVQVALDGPKKGDKKTFVLDLKNPSAQRAYEDLAKFRSTTADVMSGKAKKTGVELKPHGEFNQDTKKDDAGNTTQTRTATGGVDAQKGAVKAGVDATLQQQKTTGPGGKRDGFSGGGDANVQVTKKAGEAELQAGGSVKGGYGKGQTTGPSGEKLSKDETKSFGYGANVGVKDTTGPTQYSASASHQQESSKTTEKTTQGQVKTQSSASAQTSAAASGQRTQGEAVIKGAAQYEQKSSSAGTTGPDGNTAKSSSAKSGSVEGSVADATGPNQYSVSGKYQASSSGSSETNAQGQTTAQSNASTQFDAGATGQKTSGETVLKGGAQVQQKVTSSEATGPDGTTRSTVSSNNVSANGSISDAKGPDQYSVSGNFQRTGSTRTDTDAKGQTTVQSTSTTQAGAAASGQKTVGSAVLKGDAKVDQKTTIQSNAQGTTRTDERSASASGSAVVSDTKGPTQGSAQLSGSASTSTKTTTGPDGKTQTTQDTAAGFKAGGDVKNTSGENVAQAKASYEQQSTAHLVTDAQGNVTGNRSSTATATGGASIKDEKGPNGYRAGISATHTDASQSEITAAGTKTNTATTTDLTTGAGINRGETKLGVDLVQQWKQTTGYDLKGLRNQAGRVSTDLDLTSSFKDGRKVGFEADTSRKYNFTLPPSSTGTPALPLDAGAAQQMPEGAKFTLEGKAKFAVNGEADGFKGGISDERTVNVSVERGSGSTVKATVDFTKNAQDKEGFDKTFGGPADKKLAVTVGASRSQNRIDNRVDQFSFDLSKTEDRQAYDSLMRGNLAPAQALADKAGSTRIDTSKTSEVRGKVGVAFDKIGGSIELMRRDIDPKDPAVQSDPTRKAATEAAQKNGQDIRWIEKGGAYEIGANLSGTIPAGPVGVTLGFEGKKALEWRSLGPQINGEGGAPGPAMTADAARALANGAEFQVHGTANVSGRAGVMAGWQAPVPGVKIGAGVGFDVSRGKTLEMGVQVKKLDANTVEVRLEELAKTQTGAEFSARIGAQVNAAELAATGGSLLATLAKKPEVAEKLAMANKLLTAEFKAGTSRTEGEGKGLKFTLDLSTKEGQAAYEKLVRGNPDAALDMAGSKQSGVTLQSSAVMATDEKERHVNAQVAGVNLYSSSDVRKDVAVEVTKDQRTERLDSSVADRKQNSIWGRDRHVEVEAVSVRTPEAPTGAKFLHVEYEEKDRYTSKDELQTRRDLAKSLGAEPVTERIEPGKREGRDFLGFISQARNDFGKLQTNIDVLISDKGIAAIRGAGREKAILAFGEVLGEKDGRTLPRWAKTDAEGQESRTLLEGYRNAQLEPTRDANRRYYEEKFGKKEFEQDVKEYGRAVDFANAMERSSNDANPAAWNKALADQAQRAGFNFFDGLGAMNKLAGDDQVIVKTFTVKGRAVDIEMKSEGDLVAPKLSDGFATGTIEDARKRAG